MVTTALNKETHNKVRFMTFMVAQFAKAYKMDKKEAYFYLRQYGGLDYLREHWWALHIQNPFWVEREMFAVCRKNGGLR
ncbi:MAG: DUF3791 domain-containing protein [Prevotellaceae bacterium]|jgi:hypothetical protein|nr:DUF3791 domain-containing protein [Prevotellaceae bacterium]